VKSLFARSLRVVTVVHAALLVVMVFFSVGWEWARRKREKIIPVAFMVEAPAVSAAAVSAPPKPAPKPPDPRPAPKPPDPKPAPKPIERSTKRVTGASRQTKQPALSEEEIRRLMAMGAVAGDRTVLPDEASRCMELIRRRLHDAWIQPGAAAAAGDAAEVTIRLGTGGRILERRLSRASGNAAVDASVMEAVGRVDAIYGLTEAFIMAHQVVTVAFRVE